jgi:hypothetical protein
MLRNDVGEVEGQHVRNRDLIGIAASGVPRGSGVLAGEILGEGAFGSLNIVCAGQPVLR